LSFVIKSFGGVAHWSGDNSDFSESDKRITHFVTDRNNVKINKGVDYV